MRAYCSFSNFSSSFSFKFRKEEKFMAFAIRLTIAIMARMAGGLILIFQNVKEVGKSAKNTKSTAV